MKRTKFMYYAPYCGVMTALTFILTSVSITLPLGVKGALVHLGGAAIVIVAFYMPAVYAGVCCAAGMALYDVMCGWLLWSPFTFVIRFLQTFTLALMIRRKEHKKIYFVMGFVLSLMIEVTGYYFAEVILYGNFIAPLASIPAEIALNFAGLALGLPIVVMLKKTRLRIGE